MLLSILARGLTSYVINIGYRNTDFRLPNIERALLFLTGLGDPQKETSGTFITIIICSGVLVKNLS